MDLAAQESTAGQHHSWRPEGKSHLGDRTRDPALLDQQVVHRLLENRQVGLGFENLANGVLVQHPVGLGPGSPHRRALARIEYPELDAGPVGGARHGAAQGIHFLDQVALADTADGRVTGHLAEGIHAVGEQQGTTAHPRRRQAGLGAGVAATDHNHVKLLLVLHGHWPRPAPGRCHQGGAIIRGGRCLFKICSPV